MHNGGKEEHTESRREPRHSQTDTRKVHMADQPVVHWRVPEPPVGRNLRRIPPIPVEDSIPKPKQLASQVQVEMEETVEHQQPAIHVGQRQFQGILCQNVHSEMPRGGLQILRQRFQIGSYHLRCQEEKQGSHHRQTEGEREYLPNPHPTRPWERNLIRQGWCKHEIHQVTKGDISFFCFPMGERDLSNAGIVILSCTM